MDSLGHSSSAIRQGRRGENNQTEHLCKSLHISSLKALNFLGHNNVMIHITNRLHLQTQNDQVKAMYRLLCKKRKFSEHNILFLHMSETVIVTLMARKQILYKPVQKNKM